MNIHKDKMLWYNTRYCIGASYERSWNMGKDLKRKEFDKGIIQFILPRKKKEIELVAGSTYGNVMAHEMAYLQK